MTLLLKSKGRGNWSVLRIVLEGSRAQPLLFRVGGTIVLAGLTFRICQVTS